MANLVRFISWNINGSHNPAKRKKCLSYLKSQQADVALLQETHLVDTEIVKFKTGWVGQLFHSSYTSNKRGVAILVHKNLNFVMLKQHKDNEGRIICVEAKINGVKVNICNIYGPNKEDPDFFHKINKMMGEIDDGHTIIGGDYNQVQDGILDRTSATTSIPRDRRAIHLMMRDLGLVDIWRLVHPRDREYTFISGVHKTQSRLDYFLISKDLVQGTVDCTIGPIALTDHATVQLGLKLGAGVVKSNRWRMNVSLLQNDIFANALEEDLKMFFDTNIGSTERIGTVWEASKAYIRGKLIAQASKKKKDSQADLVRLETQLKDAEKDLAENHDEVNLRKVCELKLKVNEIYNKKVEYAMFRLKSNFYESGEKSGKLLARQLKKQDASFLIPAVKNTNGDIMTNTKDINEVFKDFYSKLYTSEVDPSEEQYEDFFANLNIPKLSEGQVAQMEGGITEGEVRAAIASLKNGKSPGLDGLPVEYYKKYVDILAPILTSVYKESFDLGQLPDTFNEAIITLILKKDKDPTEPGSYRPISLIDVDSKILTKVLATRIEKLLPSVIHLDQVGFVQGRSSSDNVRRLLHLMWANRGVDTPIAAFSLDSEKAYDRCELAYVLYTLRRFGFGEGFIKWVKIIYRSPKASVLTNGMRSPLFGLTRGQKQGDPLSPLLFTVFLEPLAVALRADTDVKGVWGGGTEHKLFLYADDILALVSDPANSIPVMLNKIETFSQISGLKINWQKSEVMPVSRSCAQSEVSRFPFKWVPVGLKYLGLKLSAELEDIIEMNLSPLLQEMKNNLERWKIINLSLWGKVNTIKMVVAPQFNYVSMMLPLTIPRGIYKQYNNMVREYLWNGKKPRINIKKMCSPRECGGLALPNVEMYNLSFELSKLARHWAECDSQLGWVKIESSLVAPFRPIQVLSQIKMVEGGKSPILKHSQWVWSEVHRLMGKSQYKQGYSSVWDNPRILIGKHSFCWESWQRNGVGVIDDLYLDTNFKSYQELGNQFNLTNRGEFWKYLQLRSSVGSVFSLNRGIEESNMLKIILDMPPVMHTASTFYKNIMEMQSVKTENLRLIWQRDLGCEISEEKWSNIVSKVGWATRDIKSKFIHYKIIHRFYYTPMKLFRMGLVEDKRCWKCKGDDGTFLHAFWECPVVLPFWKEVLRKLGHWLNVTLPVDPGFCLLGDNKLLPRGVTKPQHALVTAGFNTAARLILRNWKSSTTPELTDWTRLMTETASFEYSIARRNNVKGKFHEIWDYFYLYINGLLH